MSHLNDSDLDPEEQRRLMAQKRQDLDTKIDHLESVITGKVSQKKTQMKERANHITESIENFVNLPQQRIAKVKEGLQRGRSKVSHGLNVKQHVKEHPYLMWSASLATGMVVGALVGKDRMFNKTTLKKTGHSLTQVGRSASSYAGLAIKDVLATSKHFASDATTDSSTLPANSVPNSKRGGELKHALKNLARNRILQWAQVNFPEFAPSLKIIADTLITKSTSAPSDLKTTKSHVARER